MICPNCGRDIPDGSVCPCTLQSTPLSDNPALNIVKTIGSSPLFLVMTIFLSLSTLFTILSSAGLNDTIYNLYYYAYSMGLDLYTIESVIDAMRSTSIFSAVLSSVPAILIAVAMWLHFITCRSRLSGNISTAGLTICKVIAYITMIAQCLITLLLTAFCAILMVVFLTQDIPFTAFFSYDADEAVMIIIVCLGLFLAFFLFFMILAITYQASIIRMINRTKQVSETGMADERVSGYLVGMTYLSAIASVLMGLSALFASPLGGVATLCHGVAFILMAILLGNYRKGMNAVLYPPVQPMGTMPGYGYNPVPQPGQVPAPNQPGPADGFQQPQQPDQDQQQ
ncbi:MAG: hypothetical protein HFE95_00615 [Acutalibacter sp.]|nr:hypothetical protein [Acutalibacter sp.]